MAFRKIMALLLLGACKPVLAEPLGFGDALALAEHSSDEIAAQSADVAAAQSAARAAGALPDLKLALAVDNLPATGPEQWRVDRDFMTMRKVGLMQEIPSRARRSAVRSEARATVDEAEAQQRIHVVAVRTRTALAWIDCFYADQRIALVAAQASETQLLASVVLAQVAGGRGVPTDLIAPKQEAASLDDRQDELRASRLKARARLRRLIGAAADESLQGQPPAFEIDAEHLRSHVRSHPELAVYESKLASASAQLAEAQASKHPDWGVELSYGRRAAPYSDMVSLQVSVSLPLFPGGRQDPLIGAKHQALRQIEAERSDMLRDHTEALEGELADYAALQRQLDRSQDTHLTLATQKAEYLFASYQGGRSDLATALAARRELIATQLLQLDLRNRRDALAAQIYFSYLDSAP